MKKNLLYFIAFSILVIILFTSYCFKNQKNKIKLLEENIALLKEENIPLKFKISEKTNDSITLTIKLYNADNKEINEIKQKLSGQELSFDFYVVQIKDKYVAFPSKIFTDKIAAADGINLYGYYDRNSYPEIFYHTDINKDVYDGLQDIFTKIKAGQLDSINNYFGNMVHDIKEFKSFLPGNVYSIVTRTKGGIEIIEE
ncbi:MAG: DUF2304 domain-containing protein [Bacteroidales bacterium]|nr:DUF2304 domain-containing protein [Bacteroidales bacterium]MBN2757581.1 DUF2304 domain-containing protein [Bacteroidales bacterium]